MCDYLWASSDAATAIVIHWNRASSPRQQFFSAQAFNSRPSARSLVLLTSSDAVQWPTIPAVLRVPKHAFQPQLRPPSDRSCGRPFSRVRRGILPPAMPRIVDSARSVTASAGGADQPADAEPGAARALARCNRWTRAKRAAPTCNRFSSSSALGEEVHDEDA